MTIRIILAAITALVASGAWLLQADLHVTRMTAEGASVGAALWRLIGYFTILANAALALVCAALVLPRTRALIGPRVMLAITTTMVLVGISYSVALRNVWNPQGWQAVADHALHDATPVLCLLTWIASPHGDLRWRDALGAMAAPAGYCIYAFTRAAFDGWYPYWFIDPTMLTAAQLAASLIGLLLFTAVIALVLIAADGALARRAASGK